jgi:hydrogenase maturation factor HypF (carbamoyltransferase family)
VNRLDDSVVQVCAENTRLIRRARGYAPTALPFPSGFEEYQGLLAVGAELKNTFCLFTRTNAIVSQHIGDLKTLESYQDFMHNIALYQRLYMTNIQRTGYYLLPNQCRPIPRPTPFHCLLLCHAQTNKLQYGRDDVALYLTLPWRMAYMYLKQHKIAADTYFSGKPTAEFDALLKSNLPLNYTSSVGRLFDAVAYLYTTPNTFSLSIALPCSNKQAAIWA